MCGLRANQQLYNATFLFPLRGRQPVCLRPYRMCRVYCSPITLKYVVQAFCLPAVTTNLLGR